MPESNALAPDTIEDDLDLIREAAAEAGRIAMRYFRAKPEVWMKGQNSPVTEADLAVDTFLKEELLRARPGYGWLSEESTRGETAENHDRSFVVDPIDGTRAFIDGNDVWCVSIAVVESGKSLTGVLNCPARDEEITAASGRGALWNGDRISVSVPSSFPHVGGPSRMIRAMPEPLGDRIREGKYVPSLAYRIALVAAGKLDATFVKPNSHDWDVAAADVILSEAGGNILDAKRKAPYYAGRNPRLGALAAGSGDLLAKMASILTGFEQ